jgi:hypothetical protein
MDFAAAAGFYDAPFPSDVRLRSDGTADLDRFPNPGRNDFVQSIIGLAATVHGFGTTSAIYFSVDRALTEVAAVDALRSVSPDSPVVLLRIDDAAPPPLVPHPIDVRLLEEGGPFGAPHLLAVLPLQGAPLEEGARYAVAVRRSLGRNLAGALAPSTAMRRLLEGGRPDGMTDLQAAAHREALSRLGSLGIPTSEVVALTVFTTGRPTEGYARAVDSLRTRPLPVLTRPLALGEVFADYCVYSSTVPMPVFQEGTPPFSTTGGGWVLDSAGLPIVQREEEANVVVTIPRRPMPATGYPLAVLSRTGAGGERPLVDRGPRATNGGPAVTPGTGPALVFARAGYAGASIDGPHGGLRNVTRADEQFLVFNFSNPVALRDNLRQSALELGLAATLLPSLTFDVTGCPGALAPSGQARFDDSSLALMGHSMGASIAPLAMAFEPRYRALILSGGGGSFIENVIHKQRPIATRPVAETLVGVLGTGYELSSFDPIVNLLQWAGESADVPHYARRVVEPSDAAPRSVLMVQGIVDHYILPPIANTLSLSLGLDLGGPALDAATAELKPFRPFSALAPLVGSRALDLPAAANVSTRFGQATALVVQHPEDGIEDGHEVLFQTEAPKHQLRCFLESLRDGPPLVPVGQTLETPCQ